MGKCPVSGKTMYANAHTAKLSAANTLVNAAGPRAESTKALWVYQCPHCKHWHMSSKKRSRRHKVEIL